MTENNSGAVNPESGPGKNGPSKDPQAPVTPKKKKRRIWLKVLLGLVVLVVLLVVLAPTIIGTGMVRELVVSKINETALNGKLAIKDWSFGWTSGVHLEGVQLDDPNNEHLLSVAQIDVPISLIKAATGNIDLGDVTIKGVDFNARIDSKGQLNFLSAIKQRNAPAPSAPASGGPAPGGAGKLPNVKGTVTVEDVTGTFEDDVNHLTVGLPQSAPLNVKVAIKDINQPIEESADLGLQIDEKDFIKVKSSGTVSAIQNNLVAMDKLTADQTIELSEGDLSALSQVLHALKLDLNVTGKLDGKITATVNTLDNISADVGMNVADLSAGGKQLAGDTVAVTSCQLGVKASVVSTGGANAQIKLDMPVEIQPAGSGATNHVMVHADVAQDSLTGAGNVFQAIAARLAKSPGGAGGGATIPGAGEIKITADFNVVDWLKQVPHLVPLTQGTSLTSGTFSHETMITLGNGQVVIASDTQLKDFAGTTNGSTVKVNDIDATAGLTAVGGDHPDLHDVKVGLTSAFAQVKGGGPTLGKLSITGTSDLKNLQQQLSQLIDLDAMMQAPAGSHVTLAGTLGFDVHTDGDLTADQSDIGFGADFNATGVNIDVPGRRSINEPKLTASIGANLHHAGAQFVDAVHDLKVSVQSPAVNFAAGGDVKLAGKFGVEIPSFKITQGTIDLRLAQEEFGGALSLFVPKAEAGQTSTLMQRIADDSVRVASGSVNISGEGKFDESGFGFPQPLQIQVQPTDLTIVDEMGTAQTAHAPGVSITVSGNGTVDSQNVASIQNLTLETVVGTSGSPLFDLAMGVDATLPLGGTGTPSASRIELTKLDGNLAALQSTMGPLIPLVMPSPQTAENAPSVVQMLATNQLVCTSGTLSGSMLASCDGKTMTISKPLTVTVAGLTLQEHGSTASQNQTVLNNETVQLTAAASATGNMTAVHGLTVGVDSSFAKVRMSNGEIVLAKTDDGKVTAVGPLDMLQSVSIEVTGVDLVKIDSVINMLFNQAAAPAPGVTTVVVAAPPVVTSGTAELKVDVSRSGDTTTANVSEATVHGLAIQSAGSTTSWPSDITAKLSAAVESRDNATPDMAITDQIASASITSLAVDSGIGTTIGLTDQKPIVATNLSDPANMLVQGGVDIDGDVAKVARVAEAFGGAKANSYPYSGHFHFNESVAKAASQPLLQLRGGGNVTDFVVMGQPGPNGATAQPVFSESNISIQNPLDFDFKSLSLIIDKANPITVALNSTGAAGLGISGEIDDLALKRQIRDDNPILIQLSYDLAKLWVIAKPMLSPSSQQTLADLVISGKESRQIKLTGSLPADKPFNQAVANLSGGGYLTVDSLSTQGITLTNFDIPFSITNGILRTVYPDQPESSNAPHPATCNGGTLDIGVFRVELTQDPILVYLPRVNRGAPLNILNNVSLNTAMSKSVMGKFLNNPAFVGANQAQGLVTVTILHLEKVPLSSMLTADSAQNPALVQVQYSVTGLQLGSELLSVFGNESVSANINNAQVSFARGRVNEDTTMMIDGDKPLRFAGVVVLATEQFAPMTAYVPPALIEHFIPPADRQFIPDEIVLPMKGDMNHPKLDLGQAIAQTIKEGSKKAIINGLIQGLQHVH
jgi:hypothetical protein